MHRTKVLARLSATLVAGCLIAIPWTASHRSAEAQDVRPAQSHAGAAVVPGHLADAVNTAEGLILDFMERRGVPGMAVAVGVEGKIVWSDGFGYADLENGVPVTTLTRFRVGSISKPMTAAAVGKLHEEGRLELDAPVQRYVPSFPTKEYEVTVRQLGGHLSGIRHYRYDNPAFPDGNEFHSRDHYDSVVDALAIFQDDPLLFEPGTEYSYSSYAWNLLSAVVEAGAERDFLEYMNREVFKPLEMRSTTADHVDSIIPHRTEFYEWNDCEAEYCRGEREDRVLLNGAFTDLSYKWAGGGFLSTPEDLVRFGFGHIEPGFLGAETLRVLHESQRTSSGEETGYGIGWRTDEDSAGHRTISHGGGSVGGTSALLLYPDQDLVIAIQANLTSANFGDLTEQVARAFIAR